MHSKESIFTVLGDIGLLVACLSLVGCSELVTLFEKGKCYYESIGQATRKCDKAPSEEKTKCCDGRSENRTSRIVKVAPSKDPSVTGFRKIKPGFSETRSATAGSTGERSALTNKERAVTYSRLTLTARASSDASVNIRYFSGPECRESVQKRRVQPYIVPEEARTAGDIVSARHCRSRSQAQPWAWRSLQEIGRIRYNLSQEVR